MSPRSSGASRDSENDLVGSRHFGPPHSSGEAPAGRVGRQRSAARSGPRARPRPPRYRNPQLPLPDTQAQIAGEPASPHPPPHSAAIAKNSTSRTSRRSLRASPGPRPRRAERLSPRLPDQCALRPGVERHLPALRRREAAVRVELIIDVAVIIEGDREIDLAAVRLHLVDALQ